MELSQISKTRKKGRGNVPDYQKVVLSNPGKSLDEMATEMTGTRPAQPHAPSKVVTVRKPGIPNPYLAAGGVLAVAGGGAYLAHRQSQKRLGKRRYQQHRLEKSLSSMQRDWPSMMMRST